MNKIDSKKCVIGPCRLSYLNVFKTRFNDSKTPPVYQYDAVLLIPKESHEYMADGKAEVKAAYQMVLALMEEKFGADKVPSLKWRNPIMDGDTEIRSDGEPKFPGYWFINCSAGEDFKPALIDGAKREVRDGWNSGDWGKVKVSFYAYEHKSGNKGVGCGLLAIQFLYKDEALAGGGNDASGFEEEKTAVGVGGGKDDTDPFE